MPSERNPGAKEAGTLSEALFHIARAASITGTGALPPAVQKPADAFLVKNYNLSMARMKA
jgi:hypothetical protein